MVVKEYKMNTTTLKAVSYTKLHYSSNVYLESHLNWTPVCLYQKLQALLHIKLLLLQPTHKTVSQSHPPGKYLDIAFVVGQYKIY